MNRLQALVLGAAMAASSVFTAAVQAAEVTDTHEGHDHESAPAAMAAPADTPSSPTVRKDPMTVLARVDGKDITQGEVDKMLDQQMNPRIQQQIQQTGEAPDPAQLEMVRQALSSQVVDQLIDRAVIDEAIKPYEQKVTDEKLNATIDQIRARAAAQKVDLEEALKSQNMTLDDFKRELTKQLGTQMALEKLIEEKTGSLDPKPEDLQELQASHILIGFEGNPRDPNNTGPSETEKAEKKKKAEDLLAQIKGGADFAELAKANSTCPSAPKGGDLGFFGHGQMVPAFEEAAWKLKDGEVSDVVETQFGYHIIKVTGRRNNDSPEAKEMLRQKLMGERFRPILEELRAKAKIEDLRPASEKAEMNMPLDQPMEQPAGNSDEKPADK